MASHTAFFYGTLMAPPVLFRVCYGNTRPPKAVTDLIKIRPAILHGHERRRVRGMDYPGMIPSASSSVRGTLVTGLTDGDIWRLDIFEGDQYERKAVKVRVLKEEGNMKTGKGNVEGEEVEAQTYIFTDPQEDLEEGEWDIEHFMREKMRYWVGEQGAGEYAGMPDFLSAES